MTKIFRQLPLLSSLYLCSIASLAAATSLIVNDTRSADWPMTVAGVVSCPSSTAATTSMTCSITSSGTATFSNGTVSCSAALTLSAGTVSYDQRGSTCAIVSLQSNTLVFSGAQGIAPGVAWAVNDSYAADYVGDDGVKVTCNGGVSDVLATATSNVTCYVPPSSAITLSNARQSCVASFDAQGNFDSASSTCKPIAAALSSQTLSFATATLGIAPKDTAAKTIQVAYPGATAQGLAVSCKGANCPISTTVGNDGATLLLPVKLTNNGSMSLRFTATTNGKPVCTVEFYNQFINNHRTNCLSINFDRSANQLAFPTTTIAGDVSGQILTYPMPPSSSTSGSVIDKRILEFQNQCSQPVWFNLAAGTIGPTQAHGNAPAKGNLCAGTIPAGQSQVTCQQGTSCRYVSDTAAYCFFDLPAPPASANALDQYKLDPAGGANSSKSIDIPIYYSATNPGDNSIIFSGGASARIGCQDSDGNYTDCAIGNCNGDNNALACGFTSGTGNGATIAEFTLQRTVGATDFYDISLINGVHLPISMAPTPGQTYSAPPTNQALAYWCANPGGKTPGAKGQLGCDWEFNANLPATPNSFYYVNVEKPAYNGDINTSNVLNSLNFCSSDTDCSVTGEVCGLSLDLLTEIKGSSRNLLFSASNATTSKSGPFTCGARLGFDTAVNICSLLDGVSASWTDPFACNTKVSQKPPGGTTLIDLAYSNFYSCDGATDNCIKPQGTYQDENKVCCGCTLWEDINGLTPSDPQGCKFNGMTCPADDPACNINSNSLWDGTAAQVDVRGKIKFLKQGCPTAYAYQYDDATSTFNCESDKTYALPPTTSSAVLTTVDYNATNYTITFCPGGTSVQ